MKRGFGSDNHAPVHPKILEALLECNHGHAPSYGTDDWSNKVEKTIKEHFGPEAIGFFVFNGTAANVLAIKNLIKSHEAILCTDVAHLNVDECGAPEFFTGAKVITVASLQGKLNVEDLDKKLIRKGDQHFSQAKILSITQPTELGTVYDLSEMKQIRNWCDRNRILLHVDGARLANACAYLKMQLRDVMENLAPDAVSLGGTKNGMLFGELVVFKSASIAREFKYLRKQAGQLPSKTRYLAASFEAYLKQDLYLDIASHSLQKAQGLRKKLQDIPEIKITQPTQSNAVFANLPKAWIARAREKYFFYVWDESTFECRLMTSWDTEDSDIDDFSDCLIQLSNQGANL